ILVTSQGIMRIGDGVRFPVGTMPGYWRPNAMQSTTLETTMGRPKKAGRPATSSREDIVVKIDRGVAAQARYVAESRKISLAEYLTEIRRGVVKRDFERAAKGGAE